MISACGSNRAYYSSNDEAFDVYRLRAYSVGEKSGRKYMNEGINEHILRYI